MQKATFGAGCFLGGVEAAFRKLEGVEEAFCGYAGGHLENPSYEDVCTGKTGHAEVVQVEFDPKVVSYEALLNHFWSIHDPTTLNRQGPDTGTQYRSVIFFHNTDQEKAAHGAKAKQEASGKYNAPIVTEITSFTQFYKAEEYHQRYFEKNGIEGCGIPPK